MSTGQELVSESLMREWRNAGLITTEEVVYKAGDLFVAENVVTSSRRVITPRIEESRENKRVLKG